MRCRVVIERGKNEGCRCLKLATKGELCETHYAQLRRRGERDMLAAIERDRAAKAKAERAAKGGT